MSHDGLAGAASDMDRSLDSATPSQQQRAAEVDPTAGDSEAEHPQSQQRRRRMLGMLEGQVRRMQQQGAPFPDAQQPSPPSHPPRGLPSPALSVNQFTHHPLPPTHHPQLAPPYRRGVAPLGSPFGHHAAGPGSFGAHQAPPVAELTSSPPSAHSGTNPHHLTRHSRPSPLGTHVTLPVPGYAAAQQHPSGAHVEASPALATHQGLLPPGHSHRYDPDQALQHHLARVAALRSSPAQQDGYAYPKEQHNFGPGPSADHQGFVPPAHVPHQHPHQAVQHHLARAAALRSSSPQQQEGYTCPQRQQNRGALPSVVEHQRFQSPVSWQQYSPDQALQHYLARGATLRASSPPAQESYTYSQGQQDIEPPTLPAEHQRSLLPAIGDTPRTFTEASAPQQHLEDHRRWSLEAFHNCSEGRQQQWRNRHATFAILPPPYQQYCQSLTQDQAGQYLDQKRLDLQQARAVALRRQLDQQNRADYEQRTDRLLLVNSLEQIFANESFARLPVERREALLKRREELLQQQEATAAASPASHSRHLPAQRQSPAPTSVKPSQILKSHGHTAASHPQTRLPQQSPAGQPGSSAFSLPPNPYQRESVQYISSDHASQSLRPFSKPVQQSLQIEQHDTRPVSRQQWLADDTSFRGSSVDELAQNKGASKRPKAKVKAQVGRRGATQVKQAKPSDKQVQKPQQRGGNGGVSKRGRGTPGSATPKARPNTPPLRPSRRSRAGRLQSQPQERQLDSGEESASVFEGRSTAGERGLEEAKDQVPVASGRIDLNDASYNLLASIVFVKPEECDVGISLTSCLDVGNTCELLSDWALPDLSQAGFDARLAARTLQSASGHPNETLTNDTLILLDAAAFQSGNSMMPVTIFALLVKDDSKIRWFYQFASKYMLHDRLNALQQSLCTSKDWSMLEPQTANHKRIFVWFSTAFTSASRIPDHPDWAAAQLITDYCVSILDEPGAERRLERDPDLHGQSWLDLSTDRYVQRLPLAERTICSAIGIRPSAYLLLKRRFFKDFYKDLTQHKERIPLPAESNTTLEATRRGVARGGGGGRHGRRQKDENVKVRTVAAHQEWLVHATKWKMVRAKRLVACWRALGFLEEGRYLPWLEGGGMLEAIGEKEL